MKRRKICINGGSSVLGTHTSTKIIAVLSFLIMIIVNVFANIISINGKTTYQILNSYPNLFAPAGYTYLMCLLIDLLLAGFVLYQLGLFDQAKGRLESEGMQRIRILFITSTILYAAWSLSFHFDFMALSLVIVIIIFICLLLINHTLHTEELSIRDKPIVKLTFSILAAWILVITIITLVALLVSIGWKGFGIPDLIWNIIIIIISTSISLIIMSKYNNIAYGLTIIWAYTGILVKHLSVKGYHGQYTEIIVTTIICIVILTMMVGYLFVISKRKL